MPNISKSPPTEFPWDLFSIVWMMKETSYFLFHFMHIKFEFVKLRHNSYSRKALSFSEAVSRQTWEIFSARDVGAVSSQQLLELRTLGTLSMPGGHTPDKISPSCLAYLWLYKLGSQVSSEFSEGLFVPSLAKFSWPSAGQLEAQGPAGDQHPWECGVE